MKKISFSRSLSSGYPLLLFFVITCLFTSGLFHSCKKEEPAKTVHPEEAGVERSALAELTMPTAEEGIITFISGEVFLNSGGEWRRCETGDIVHSNESVRTEAGSCCEIQFGDYAVVRLEEKTLYRIQAIEHGEGARNLSARVDVGTLLCKISHLTGEDDFFLETPSVAVGVRGTDFLLQRDENGKVIAAVKNGSVALFPASLANPETRRLLPQLEEKTRGESIHLTAGEQIIVGSAAGKQMEQTNTDAAQLLSGIIEKRREETRALADLEDTIRGTSSFLAESASPKPVDDENVLILKRIDDMRQVDLDRGRTGLVRIAVTSDPDQAAVILNGEKMRATPCSGIYPVGMMLSFRLEKAGYIPKDYSFTPGEGDNMLLRITLEKSAVPAHDETQQPGSDSREPRQVSREIEKAGTATSAGKPAAATATLTVTVEPDTADIYINGSPAGTGTFTGSFMEGETVSLAFSHELYEEKKDKVNVGPGNREYTYSLDLKEVVRSFDIFDYPVVFLAAYGTNILAMNARGDTALCSVKGDIISSFSTGITPEKEGVPTIHDGRLYHVGGGKLAVADITEGSLLISRETGAADQFIFGRRVTILNGKGIFPGTDSITFFDTSGGEIINEVKIAQGMRMVPEKVGEKIVTVNRKGQVLILDQEGQYEDILPTTVLGDGNIFAQTKAPRIYLVDDKGASACIDVPRGKLLWESPLPGSDSDPRHYSIEEGEGIIYLSGGGTITALPANGGQTVFGPIENAAVPPLYVHGVLYVCRTDEKLDALNGDTGNVIHETELDSPGSCKPVRIGDFIAVGTSAGEVVVVNPEAFR